LVVEVLRNKFKHLRKVSQSFGLPKENLIMSQELEKQFHNKILIKKNFNEEYPFTRIFIKQYSQ